MRGDYNAVSKCFSRNQLSAYSRQIVMKLREKRNQKGPQTISLVARIREQNYKNSSADLNKLK